MAGYGLARMQYRPRLGNVLLFAGCVLLAAAGIVALGIPWPIALAAALALFLLLVQTVGRRFRRSLGNDDIAFWMISQRILPPVAVVIPVYVLFQQIGLRDSLAALILGSMAGYGLARMRYRPRLGNVLLFVACIALAVAAIIALGVAWPVALAAALALFLLLLQTVGRRFRRALGNDDIAFWMISQRILPPVAVVIPVYVLFQQIGLRDSLAALIITYVAVNLPIVVWLMRDSFQAIPIELEESAMIDGASRFTIFRKVVLPISRPSLASAFLLMLILTWNEYLLALMLSTADTQTLPLLIAAQNATRGPQWWYMSVLILIMIVPVVAMAIALERYIRRGMLIGAVKG
jgi:multiple sugar transport system permease protein